MYSGVLNNRMDSPIVDVFSRARNQYISTFSMPDTQNLRGLDTDVNAILNSSECAGIMSGCRPDIRLARSNKDQFDLLDLLFEDVFLKVRDAKEFDMSNPYYVFARRFCDVVRIRLMGI